MGKDLGHNDSGLRQGDLDAAMGRLTAIDAGEAT
jgi:hypothetical protein